MNEAAIIVRDLHKTYGPREVLRGVTFEVRTGEVFGLLGPNGAGKTTTIEILEGFRRRTAGEVSVLGIDPEAASREWRERVGIVLQECELNPLLTVDETLSMFSRFYRRPRPVEETTVLVGLAAKADSRVATLSGGERRRLDVAVGLIGDPDLLFLDEPTTGFDPAARRDAWNVVERLRSLGKTILLTTHYMEEAQHLADRVAILLDGEIAALGRPRELAANGGATAVVSFRLPEDVPVADVRAHVDAPVEIAGGLATIRSEVPQRTLYELTSWAERARIELVGLSVSRPALEDVFLELTGAGRA